MIKNCPEILQKTTAEIKYYTFDFSEDLESDETLINVTFSATPTGLTISIPTAQAQEAQAKISGGLASTTYTVTCTATTSATETIEASGLLEVEDH